MQQVWAILPFAIGSAMSPLILTASIFAISQPKRPLAKSLAFLAGAAISIAIIGSFIILLNLGAKKASSQPSLVDAEFQLVAGVALIIFALRKLFKKRTNTNKHSNKATSVWKYFVLGIGLMAVNTSTIFLYFPAAVVLTKESATMSARVSALGVMILFSLLPAMVAPLLLVVLGKHAQPVLRKLSDFVERFGPVIIAVLFGLIGVFLLIKSIMELMALR